MITFEEWYKSNYPELDPKLDNCYGQLKKCYEDGWDSCAYAQDCYTCDEVFCHENE